MKFKTRRVVPHHADSGPRKFGVISDDPPMLLTEAKTLAEQLSHMPSPEAVVALSDDLSGLDIWITKIVAKYPDDDLVRMLVNYQQLYWPAAQALVLSAQQIAAVQTSEQRMAVAAKGILREGSGN